MICLRRVEHEGGSVIIVRAGRTIRTRYDQGRDPLPLGRIVTGTLRLIVSAVFQTHNNTYHDIYRPGSASALIVPLDVNIRLKCATGWSGMLWFYPVDRPPVSGDDRGGRTRSRLPAMDVNIVIITIDDDSMTVVVVVVVVVMRLRRRLTASGGTLPMACSTCRVAVATVRRWVPTMQVDIVVVSRHVNLGAVVVVVVVVMVRVS